MKSKMKSTFAIIAVALMVMVAVVPMIGIFTSDSDANQATIVDPKTDTTEITVTVVLYDEKGTAVTTGTGFIKLAYGSYELLKSISNATTGAEFKLHEKTISSVTITYVDSKLEKVDDYSAVTINNLVDGKSYTADLKKGLASQNIKFEFKNVTTTVASLLGETGTMAAKYSVYATAAETDTTIISTGDLKFSDDFETATFWFPAKNASGTSYTTVQIVISNFSCSIGVTIAAEKKQVNINATTTAALKVNEDLVYVAPNGSTANSKITVTELKQTTTGSAVESENTTIAFTMITDVIKSDGTTTPTCAYFFGKIATGTGAVNKYSLALSADGSSSDASDISLTDTNKVVYTIKDAFYGNVAMGTIAVTQSGTLTADIMSGTTAEATKVGSASVNVDKSGNFFKFITLTGTGSTISNIKFGTFVPTTNDSYSGTSALTFTIPNAGFSEVSGSLLLAEGKGIAEKALTVAGSTVFGSTETGAAGAFKFAAETNKTITFTTSGAQLSGDVSVVVGAGSSGASSKTLALYISTQTVTIKAQDALGNSISGETVKLYTKAIGGTEVPTVAGFTYSSVKETYSAEIRADVTATEYFVDISGNGYTFIRAAYVAGQAYQSAEATYTFQFYKTDGTVYATAASAADVYLSNVYKTTQGTYVFEPIDPTDAGKATVTYDSTTTSATYGTYTMAKVKATNFASESSIGQKVIQAYVVYPQSGLTDNIVLKGAYVLDPDDEGACVIAASYDSLTATLTRSDKETPISGAKVTLLSAATSGTELDVTVTDADGSFTVYTSVPFSTTQRLSFAKDGYTTGTDILDTAPIANNKKIKAVAATNDLYTFSVVDADGSEVEFTENYKLTFKSDITIPATEVAQKTMKLTVGERIVPTYKDNASKTVRTFGAYYVTAEDIASGEIALVSNESTYTVLVTDSDGIAINGGTNFNLKAVKYLDGVKTGDVANTDVIGKFTKVPLTVGVYTTVLTGLNSGEEYRVIAYGASATTNAVATNPYFASENAYAIDYKESWTFKDNVATVESMYTAITFSLEDAAGNAIAVPTDAVGLQVSSLTHAQVTVYQQPAAGTMYFIGVEDDLYFVYSEKEISGYKFTTMCYVDDGVLASPEQKVSFRFTDNAGAPLVNIQPTVSYYTTNGGTVLIQNTATDAAGVVSTIFEAKDTYTYGAVLAGYAFAYQDGFVFADKYTYVVPSFVSANGCDVSGNLINNAKVTAYDEYGAVNGTVCTITVADGKATIPAMRVDLDAVAYFKLTDNAGCKYTFGDSLLPQFVANESYITGTVPYSGKGTGSATLELYLEGNMVKEMKDNVKIVDKYYYEAILDLSGYIGDTAAVVFDSIIVVYYENGVELGYAAVDPFTAVNNIVTPEVEIYVAVLDAPSALIARHVSIAQVGNTATVSADGQFIVADDDAIYTDGQYIYTFAGWYVDNEKVSSAPSFTFSLTENVVIVPEYTVKYEKISDANAQVDPEIIIEEITKENTGIDTNVLIIGICAVIVALIAVVYAVIKKE